MPRKKIIAGLILLALFVSTGWQIAACEYANYELKDDLKVVASLGASRIGLAEQQSDDQLRAAVMRKAAAHEMVLEPEEIRVARSGTGEMQTVFLEAKYGARIWLPGYRLLVRFRATSAWRYAVHAVRSQHPVLNSSCSVLIQFFSRLRQLQVCAAGEARTALRSTAGAAVPT